jgi:hypothetical protein
MKDTMSELGLGEPNNFPLFSWHQRSVKRISLSLCHSCLIFTHHGEEQSGILASHPRTAISLVATNFVHKRVLPFLDAQFRINHMSQGHFVRRARIRAACQLG